MVEIDTANGKERMEGTSDTKVEEVQRGGPTRSTNGGNQES